MKYLEMKKKLGRICLCYGRTVDITSEHLTEAVSIYSIKSWHKNCTDMEPIPAIGRRRDLKWHLGSQP